MSTANVRVTCSSATQRVLSREHHILYKVHNNSLVSYQLLQGVPVIKRAPFLLVPGHSFLIGYVDLEVSFA